MKRRRHNPERALIFDWSAHEGGIGRLLLAGLITLGTFTGLFIAFRIITPETRPVTTRPQQVLVLNPEVPAERALINQASDRSFALIPTDSGAGSLPSAVQLPSYRPGIASFEMKPKPLSATAAASERPRFFSLEIDPKPPAPRRAAQPLAEPPPSTLRAVLEGEAAARLTQSAGLNGIPLVDPSRPRFQLSSTVMQLP